MKKKLLKSIVFVMLAIMLLVGTMPVTAFAAIEDGYDVTIAVGESYKLTRSGSGGTSSDWTIFSGSGIYLDQDKAIVTGYGPGTASVRSYNTKNGWTRYTITVVEPFLSSETLSVPMDGSDTLTLYYMEGIPVANEDIIWTSSDESIATVGADGTINGLKGGKVTVSAQYFDYTYSCAVTIKDAAITSSKLTMTTGTGATLRIKHPNGKYVLSSAITWESSDSAVAKVSAKGGVTAVKAGTATITGTYRGKAYTCKVTVKNATFNYSSYTLIKGEQLHLKLRNAAGQNILDSSLTWKSSNSTVASVTAGGYVKAIKAGTATITATYKGKSYTSKITVASAKMNNAGFKLGKGNTYQLKLTRPNGSAIANSKITWKSSNTSIATVSSTGAVKGLKFGDVTITATYKGYKYTSKITVTYAPETGSTRKLTYKVEDVFKSYDFVAKTAVVYKVTAKVTEENYWGAELEASFSGYSEGGVYYESPDYTAEGVGDTVSFTFSAPAGKYSLHVDNDGVAVITVEETKKPGIVGPTRNLGRGYTFKFKAENVKNGGTWSSSNTSIATVSSTGSVKAKKNGSCYIYYTLYNGKKLSYKIKVVNPVTVKVTYVSDVAIYNDCYVEITNNTPKTIDYTELNIKQYNYRGSRVSSPYSYYYDDTVIKPYTSDESYYWVNDNAETCTASVRYVRFTDGTKWDP